MTDKLTDYIKSKGFNFKPTLDGERHTVTNETFKGWYIGSEQDTAKGKIRTLTFQDWRDGEKFHYAERPENLSKVELAAAKASADAEKGKFEAAKRELQTEVSERAFTQWGEFDTAAGLPGYFTKKGLTKYIEAGTVLGTKIVRNPNLDTLDCIIPMRDTEGKIWNYQVIGDDGSKTFLDGGLTTGVYHRLGPLNPKGVIYIVEGFATGATLYAITGRTVAIAFNAFNLEYVGKALRAAFRNISIVYCGDNDRWNVDKRGLPYNTGFRAADRAASLTQGSTCGVSFGSVAPEQYQSLRPTDFNDLLLGSGEAEVLAQVNAHYETKPHEYIPTEHTGFHREELTKQGVRLTPEPNDLKSYYDRHTPHITLSSGKVVYAWTGEYYRKAMPAELAAYAEDKYIVDERSECTNILAKEFEGKMVRSNLKPIEWFYDTTEGMVNFDNGVLDFHTGEFIDRDSGRGFRHVLDYEFDPEAQCPEFDQMMERLFPNDPETQLMLMEFMGYCISGDEYWCAAALLLIGRGSNGKSTFMRIIQNLINRNFTAGVALSDLKNEQFRAALDGALVNLSEENEPDALHRSGHFKNLSDGGMVSAKVVYEATYTFKNRAKFVFAFNEMPRSKDDSQGLARRLYFADFKADFEKQEKDPKIMQKLLAERSGIFNRARAVYLLAKERGALTMPKASKNTLDQFKYESNPVAQFCDVHSVKVWSEGDKLPSTMPKWCGVSDSNVPYVVTSDIYVEFVNWAKSNGYAEQNVVSFGRKLVAVLDGCKSDKRVTRGGKRQRALFNVVWHGGLEA